METRNRKEDRDERKRQTGRKNDRKNGRNTLSVKEIVLYSLFGSLIFVCKMAMASLPNIEPVSLLIILMAVVFGKRSILAVVIYILAEYLFWGVNLWSVSYAYLWPMLFYLAYFLKEQSVFVLALVSGAFGLFFGALCAVVYLFIGGWSMAVSWWLAGIPFDLVHGISNFCLFLLLGGILRKVLERLKGKSFQNQISS